jgi:hypothetical protein
MIIDICVLIITSIAAIATYYEYRYKYKLKKLNILKYLRDQINFIDKNFNHFNLINDSFYKDNENFILTSFNYELSRDIFNLFMFINTYNETINNQIFRSFISNYES